MKYLGPPQTGSQNGTTASRNRFGQYYRTRATPVNPRTTPQGDIRTILNTCSVAWRGLTDSQRAGWASQGAGMTRTDSLGSSYTLTGQQAFISINIRRLVAGSAIITDPPLFPAAGTYPTFTLAADSGAGTISLSWLPTPTDQAFAVWLSGPLSVGVNFVSRYAQLATIASGAASPTALATAWTARFGPLVSGFKIAFKARGNFASDGNPGSFVYGSTIIV